MFTAPVPPAATSLQEFGSVRVYTAPLDETLIDISKIRCKGPHRMGITTGSPKTTEQKIRTRHPPPSIINLPHRLCSTSIPHLTDSGVVSFVRPSFCSHLLVRSTVHTESDTHSLLPYPIDRNGRLTCKRSHDTGLCRVGYGRDITVI